MLLWWACGLFSAMIEMTCHVNHFFDLWQWCNFSGIVKRPLNFRVFIHEYVFPVFANARTKSIQKQIKSINVDRVGSKNLQRINVVSCTINRLLFVHLISKQARLNATVKALMFFNYTAGYANTGKKVFCWFWNNFPEKKSKTLLFRLFIKREILTSREVLYTKLERVISLCFAKKMFSEIRVFLV